MITQQQQQGVGKTQLAKSLSEEVFNNNIVRLDMSEYSEAVVVVFLLLLSMLLLLLLFFSIQ